MKRFYAAAMVVVFVAFSATVFAYGPKGAGYGSNAGNCPGYSKGAGFGHGARMAALNLTQEQQDKMWQAREKYRNDTSATRYEMFKKRAELKKLYVDPKANDAAILAKQKEVNVLKQTMQDKNVEHKLAQRKILTPEQIKKIGEAGYGHGKGKGFGMSRGAGIGKGMGQGAGPSVQ